MTIYQASLLLIAITMVSPSINGQQAQNPSPMVEHTRTHPRLSEEHPPGRRVSLELGTLFVPRSLERRRSLPLLIHFHGGSWIPEVAAAKTGAAAISIQIGAGSGTYARAFSDPELFPRLLREAEAKSGIRFTAVTLGAWSAGHGSIREILRVPESYARVDAVLLIDGMHTGYEGGRPGPQESQIEPANLEIFVKFARDAAAGRKRMLITHSEIFPGTFASTTETADWLLRQLSIQRKPVLKWGPMGTQQLSEGRLGRFLLIGYAGNSAPDHVDQLHSLPTYLKWMR